MSAVIIKLSNGNVVVSENGISRVITPPVGVSLQKAGDLYRWQANVVSKAKDRRGQWTTESTSFRQAGILEGFYSIVAIRKKSLGFILNTRMLPRMRQGDPVRRADGTYRVFDPYDRVVISTRDKHKAIDLNNDIIDRWKDDHSVRESELVRLTVDSVTV